MAELARSTVVRFSHSIHPACVLGSSSRLSSPHFTQHITRTRCRRYQSTSAASPRSPSSKISAVPFRLDPSAAAHKLHINGLIATAKFSNMVFAALLKLFGPGVAAFAKEFGLGEGLSMREMKAVYWPVWRVDALLEGKVDVKGKGKEGGRGWVAIREGYVPGSSFAPLSYLSFAVPPLADDLPAYNPAKDLSQLGEGFEIVPVPFSVSPFAFAKKLRRAIGRRGSWEELTVDETEWRESMLACYPVMFPIYVAEFEHKTEDGSRRFTVVMDAHDSNANNCRASWPPPPEIFETGRFTSNYYVNPAPFLPISHFLIPIVLPAALGPPLSPTILNELYTSYLSPEPTSVSSIPPSPLFDLSDPASIEWSDARIQSWSGSDREENDVFWDKSLHLWKAIGALEGISQLSSQLKDGADPMGMVVNVREGQVPKAQSKPMSEIRRQMEEDVEKLKAELVGLKPGWLMQLEQRGRTGGEGGGKGGKPELGKERDAEGESSVRETGERKV